MGDLLLQLGQRVALCKQPQFTGAQPAEALGGQGKTAGGAFANRLHDKRADDGRGQADAHLRQAELRILGTNRHVAGADQAQSTAIRGTLHHRQGRDFQFGQVVHQLGQVARVIQVGVVVEFGRLLHPGQIGPGAEMLAASAQQQKAQRAIALNLIKRDDQFLDHLGVKGVVLLLATQPQGGETPRVGVQFKGVEVVHVRQSFHRITCGTRRNAWLRWARSTLPTSPAPTPRGFAPGQSRRHPTTGHWSSRGGPDARIDRGSAA